MTEAGLYPKISRPVYERIEAANYSLLKLFERSAAHAHQQLVHPSAPTPALELGQHLHAAVLEPERFEKEYVLAPKVDRRTNVGKAEWAAFEQANAGRVLLKADDYELIAGVRAAVWEHPTAAALLRGAGHLELGAVWKHDRTGELCKALIDRMASFDGHTWVVDLKSTQSAAPGSFARDAARYHYHAQAAHYLAGCNAIAPRPRRFAWIAVEKEPPYAVAVYEPDQAALLAGEALCERWLDAYAQARRSGEWPGYSCELQSLTLPRWATEVIFD